MKLTDVLTPDIRNYDLTLLGVWVSLQSLQPSTGIKYISSLYLPILFYLKFCNIFDV